jgi:hypothetical protein
MSNNRLRKDRLAAEAADRLEAPDGLDRYAVRRAIDREEIAASAPDVDTERLRRIVRLRDEIRRGTYVTDERLAIAIARALEAISRMRRRSPPELS